MAPDASFEAEAAQDELWAVVQLAFLRHPLAELLRASAAAGLELIVLKGAALAETVYPRPSLRPYGDIDILVRLEDAPRAGVLLSALGYVPEASAWATLSAGQTCQANFFRHAERGPVVVELHTDLLNNALLQSRVRLDHAGLWRRSRPALLAGAEARVLGPEDQILHLCLHLAGHYFDAPQSLQDIAQVCAGQPVDWPLFESLCRDAGAASIGYGGLFVAVQRSASVPLAVLERLAPARHRRLLERVITARVTGRAALGSEAQRFRLIWLLLESAGARLHAVRHLLFPRRVWLHAHYFFDLPNAAALRFVPLGLALRVMHGRFLLQALGRLGRSFRRGKRT